MRNDNNFDKPAQVIKRADAPERTVYALTFREAFVNFFTSRFSRERLERFVKESFPRKDDSRAEKIRKIIMDVSFVLLVLGLSYMVFYYVGYRERINDLKNWETAIDNINEEELFDFEIEKLWENIKEQYPDIDFPEGMALKFANLYAVNQDVVGLLRIPELDFFSPLLQNKTSPSYYLWKDLYGQYSRYGNPYVDYRCDMDGDGFSKNTIIYGHNTHDKLGFNKLTGYMKLDGYKKAPVITVETLYEKTQWKIFAVMLTNSTSAADRGHLFSYLITDFASTSDFNNLLAGIKERSMIKTGVDVKADDKILTLYTCYQDIFDGGRLVVFARLVRDGESAEVDVSKASFNNNARYPQAYYDQLGLKNPYEDQTQPIVLETDADGNWIEVTTDTEFSDDPSQEGTTDEESATVEAEKTTAAQEATTAKPQEQTTAKAEDKTTAAATTAPATTAAATTAPATTAPATTAPATTAPATTAPATTAPATTAPATTAPATTAPATTAAATTAPAA